MSVRVMADIWDFGPEDAVDCSVLICLANHAGDDGGNCFPSIERIAKMARRSQRTVERAIQTLEEGGWLTVTRGVGRGKFSQYKINVRKLKERQSDAFMDDKRRQADALPEDKERQPQQEKATATTVKGDSGDSVYRRTVIKPSEETLTPKAPIAPLGEGDKRTGEIVTSTDPRWNEIREDLKGYWSYCNPAVPMPFDGKVDGKALKTFLKRNPTLTRPMWKQCLWNRARSEVPHADEIHRWILSLLKFSEGAFDGYGKKITTGGGRKHDDAQQLIDANRASGDAWLEQRRQGRAAEGVPGRVRGHLGTPDPTGST